MGRLVGGVLFMAASCMVISTCGSMAEAQTITMREPFVNEVGDLELEFSQRTLPRAEMLYRGRAIATLTSVCVDGLGRPLLGRRYRQTIQVTMDRTIPLVADFAGQVLGLMTLYAPRDEVTLACPSTTIPEVAAVGYRDIEVRNQVGETGTVRNIRRTFIRLP